MVWIDEGADGKAAAGGKMAEDQRFGRGAMTKSGGQGQEAGAGDQARCDKAQAASAGQHQGGQGHAQRGRGLGEFAVGFGWVEAERLRAFQAGEGEQGRALGIDEGAQSGRQGDDLGRGDHEKKSGKAIATAVASLLRQRVASQVVASARAAATARDKRVGGEPRRKPWARL